ncbi:MULTISPECIES: CU044_5270 family protein [unclassified Nonomuraea]|uniref:CU044_5270 family protein n=1 Tax=unclassified Nonomuraea TaxID=2593643 RepID=UPI0033D3EB61
MKEFQLIDDVMPDMPPADPARTMGIRAQLMGRPPRRRLPGWSRATLAAAAVTLVLVGGFVVVPRLGGGEVQTAATSNVPPVLAAAADRLAAQPPGTGAWWRREVRQVSRQVGKGKPAYVVEQRTGEVLWVSRKGETRLELKPVTTVPLTPADKRAWKEAGSLRLCNSTRGCTLGRVFFTPFDPKKLEPVGQLPTDAKALKAELLKQYPADGRDTQEAWLWAASRWLLLDVPSTPGTRAAVYRMLAGLPQVKVTDGVKDDEGRAGVALLLGDPLQQQIIIDRDSGDLLAVQSKMLRSDGKQATFPIGRTFESLLVERLGWTDEQPTEKVERRPGSR